MCFTYGKTVQQLQYTQFSGTGHIKKCWKLIFRMLELLCFWQSSNLDRFSAAEAKWDGKFTAAPETNSNNTNFCTVDIYDISALTRSKLLIVLYASFLQKEKNSVVWAPTHGTRPRRHPGTLAFGPGDWKNLRLQNFSNNRKLRCSVELKLQHNFLLFEKFWRFVLLNQRRIYRTSKNIFVEGNDD